MSNSASAPSSASSNDTGRATGHTTALELTHAPGAPRAPSEGGRASGRAPRGAQPGAYLMVVPVRIHRVGPDTIATEGAFCEHLRALRRALAPRFTHLTVAAPSMPSAEYERGRAHLGRIDEEREGIRFVALQPGDTGRFGFWWRHAPSVLRRLWREVRRAELVHAGTSHDVYRPIEFSALVLAHLSGRKTICVVDIDLREEARMNHLTGRWSTKSLLLCRLLYDPLRNLQLHGAARRCSLVLLKGRRMCRDYGRGREQVKYILESAYSAEQLIPPAALERKRQALADPAQPLELVYFGRLAGYKGVDRCLRAVALAVRQSRTPIRFTIIGDGEEAEGLRRLRTELGLEQEVEFLGAQPFGPQLFDALYPRHLLLAAPLSEDTPRSALDAMACGIPILAFDTEYYSSLAESGAVDLVPWPSVEALAARIVHHAEHKQDLVPLALAGIEFARANTQETWLQKRAQWTLDLFGAQLEPAGAGTERP